MLYGIGALSNIFQYEKFMLYVIYLSVIRIE